MSHLTKGKIPRSEPRSQEPAERALGKMFEPEVEPVVIGDGPLASPDALLTNPQIASLGDFGLPAEGTSFDVPPGLIGLPQFIGGGGAGGGGPGSGGSGPGGGSPGGGGTVSPPTVEVPSAVPEPGTWAMLLLGMGLCGFTMRRRRGSAEERRSCESV